MFKKISVIILQTKEEANSLYGYKNTSLLFNYNKEGYKKLKAEEDSTEHFHLYFLSDDEIREGDWYISKNTGVPLKASEDHIKKFKDDRKIIATTDKSLGLPEPSEEFLEEYIQKYNKRDIITEVVVKYEDILSNSIYFDGLWDFKKKVIGEKLKINPKNNTITVREVKNTWTREEVVKLLEKYQEELGDNSPGIYSEIAKWKEQNL